MKVTVATTFALPRLLSRRGREASGRYGLGFGRVRRLALRFAVRRLTVRLGKMDLRQAEGVRVKIEGLLSAAEAFVLPSHQENFGIAVAEALACGTTPLVTDIFHAERWDYVYWRETSDGKREQRDRHLT